ncbi:MAG: hypothetical protein AAFY72_17435 [Cyanobacteria bacterium J06649_4]
MKNWNYKNWNYKDWNYKAKHKRIFSFQILYLCLVTDIAFVALNMLYEFHPSITDSALKITQDRGYAEVFQYIKEFWIAGTLALIFFRTRSLLFLGWSALFFYLLLDDSLRIHENWSKAPYFPALFGLGSNASGELIISLCVGLFFLIWIAAAYKNTRNGASKAASKALIWMLFLLGFAGVFIDAVHIIVQIPFLDPILTVLEDGGEMLVMSLILSFVLLLPQQIKRIHKSSVLN